MKQILIITVLFLLVTAGCVTQTDTPPAGEKHDLALTAQDLVQLGLTSDLNDTIRQMYGLENDSCQKDEAYSNVVDSSTGSYSICAYLLPGMSNTEVVVEIQRFENTDALNGTYLYQSSHLFSIEALISKDTLGDQSTFRVNSEHDYGGEFNPPGVYFYHLWIAKDLYLIHITSKGSDVKENIEAIGQLLVSKLD